MTLSPQSKTFRVEVLTSYYDVVEVEAADERAARKAAELAEPTGGTYSTVETMEAKHV